MLCAGKASINQGPAAPVVGHEPKGQPGVDQGWEHRSKQAKGHNRKASKRDESQEANDWSEEVGRLAPGFLMMTF